MSLFQLHNVSFSYDSGQSVLRNIRLDVEEHSLVIIRGESGAGKSTFLKLFNRFCDVHTGNIVYHGKDLRGYGIEDLRSRVVYLPQTPLMVDGSVEDNLSFPFSFHAHQNRAFDRNRARKWLDLFQLTIPLDQDALKLSVGQRQRVALIRAMLLEPEVLLLDEPGSSLDSVNKRLIEEKIEDLVRSTRCTLIMATHSDVTFSAGAHRMYRLEAGTLKKNSHLP